MIKKRTDEEIIKILELMGYVIKVFDQSNYPIEMMNDRLQVGGRFWNKESAYRTAILKELDLLEGRELL